jgi:hypothetical protein
MKESARAPLDTSTPAARLDEPAFGILRPEDSDER